MYKIEEANTSNGYLMMNSNGVIISTHNMNPYPPLPQALAELMIEDLNSISERNVSKAEKAEDESEYLLERLSDDLLGNELRESLVYCVLSTFIERPKHHQSEIDLEFLQWDRAFRTSPGPPAVQYQIGVVSQVKPLLSEWVDLPLNYARSFEEMEIEEVPMIPQSLVDQVNTILGKLDQVQLFTVSLLFEYFERFSLVFPIFYITGRIQKELLVQAYFAFQSPELMDNGLENNERYQYFCERLLYLHQLLKLNSNNEILDLSSEE